MTNDEAKDFIKTTVDEIMTEINKNIEMTLDIKIKEKTVSMKKNETEQLNRDVELLRNENSKLKKDLSEAPKHNTEIKEVAKQGLQKVNQNEQYSWKNNVKIQNIEEDDDEDEISLINTVRELLQKQSVVIRPEQIIVIYRIPSKPGST